MCSGKWSERTDPPTGTCLATPFCRRTGSYGRADATGGCRSRAPKEKGPYAENRLGRRRRERLEERAEAGKGTKPEKLESNSRSCRQRRRRGSEGDKFDKNPEREKDKKEDRESPAECSRTGKSDTRRAKKRSTPEGVCLSLRGSFAGEYIHLRLGPTAGEGHWLECTYTAALRLGNCERACWLQAPRSTHGSCRGPAGQVTGNENPPENLFEKLFVFAHAAVCRRSLTRITQVWNN